MEEEKEIDNIETDEERQLKMERMAAEEAERLENWRKISEANCARVQFTQATVKEIVSYHSSSILSEKVGKLVPLTAKMEAAARSAFKSVAIAKSEDEKLYVTATVEVIADLLIQCEATPFAADSIDEQQRELLHGSITKLMSGSSFTFDEDAFCAFCSKFYNPPYYYGERVRKLVGRGCLQDAMDVFTRGCNVNTADGDGTTALHYCAEFSRLDIVKTMSDVFKGSLIIDAKDKQGWTPLYNAVHYGNLDCVQELLLRGASVNVCNQVGKTVLHCAAAQGRVAICELLLSSGASASVGDSTGMTPLHEAAYKAQSETYELLLTHATCDADAKDKLGNRAVDYLGEYSYAPATASAKQESLPAPPPVANPRDTQSSTTTSTKPAASTRK